MANEIERAAAYVRVRRANSKKEARASLAVNVMKMMGLVVKVEMDHEQEVEITKFIFAALGIWEEILKILERTGNNGE